MARTPKTSEVIDLNDTSIDKTKVAGAMALMQADAAGTELALAQHESAVRAVAQRLGYQLDSTDPDLIQRDVVSNMRRSVEACMELGKGLCVLKTACGHGKFMERLGDMKMSPDLAGRLMQTAVKFSNSATSRILNAVNSQSKLLELLCLDDEQIAEFELTGQSGELSLDDVATMSVMDLRAKLREARQEKKAVEKLLERKNKMLDDAQLVQSMEPDEKFELALTEVAKRANTALGYVRGDLRRGFESLAALESGGDNSHRGVMKGYLDDLQRELDILRADYFLLADAA